MVDSLPQMCKVRSLLNPILRFLWFPTWVQQVSVSTTMQEMRTRGEAEQEMRTRGEADVSTRRIMEISQYIAIFIAIYRDIYRNIAIFRLIRTNHGRNAPDISWVQKNEIIADISAIISIFKSLSPTLHLKGGWPDLP